MKLLEPNKNIRFFIIGDGELKQELTGYSTQLNIDWTEYNEAQRSATLTFTSWIKDMDEAYAGLDIVALTSLNEGTPVTLIEAQAAGKPIVTTNVGGVANTVSVDNTALIIESNDSVAFADSLIRLCNNYELRKEMSVNGWILVEKRFHYTRLVNDTRTLYANLLEKYQKV